MGHKKTAKPYWDMTTEELREATKEFDNEFVADKAQPLTPQVRSPVAAGQEQATAYRERGGGKDGRCAPGKKAVGPLHGVGEEETH